MADEPESSDSLRTFGAVVKALRMHAGLSREEFGLLVKFSPHTVASIEQGRRMPDPDFVEAAEDALGNTGALREAFGHVTRQPGLANWVRLWARHEAEAIALCTYECRLVPGLLQTDAYTRVLFERCTPPWTDDEVTAQLAARSERQALLLERPHTTFGFILDEHILTRRVGGPEVTRDLLEHIIRLTSRRNIRIQILPHSVGYHPGLDGPIMLLETPEHLWLGFAEGQRSGQLISAPRTVSVLKARYAELRMLALSAEESKNLLNRMLGAL